MRGEVFTVEETEFSRQDTSIRIRLMLLRAGSKWHVATRRGLATDEGDHDYGGEDTYVEELSRQDMTEEAARGLYVNFAVAIIVAKSWGVGMWR